MSGSVVIVMLLVAIAALAALIIRNTSRSTLSLDDMYVESGDGRKRLHEYIAGICSETTRKVLEEQLGDMARQCFQKGYDAALRDIGEQLVSIAREPGRSGDESA